MLPYQAVAYRPPESSPRSGPYGPSLGQGFHVGRRGPGLHQTFDEIMGWPPVFGDVLRLAFHAGTAYLGAYVGLEKTGFIKVFAWILGVGNGLAAIADVISLIKRAAGTHPPPPAPAPRTSPGEMP